MFIERRVNSTTGAVELWSCEWDKPGSSGSKKKFLSKMGVEQPISPDKNQGWESADAVCWSKGRTIGNIAVFSEEILGRFPSESGDDAELPCDFVDAGKFRHGAPRWWCRTHQTHWGTKADLAAYAKHSVMRCSNASQKMSYTLKPFRVDVDDHHMVGIWCSLPPGRSSQPITKRPARIHVHVRKRADEKKVVDTDFDAVSLFYNQDLGLFEEDRITRVNITPPSAFEFLLALEQQREVDCINCNRCGFPHLDLGSFAEKPHRKHFCGNCGWDSTWSKTPIVSTPLKPLHDQLAKDATYVTPDRHLDLDRHAGADFFIWASTPAIVWTADRPQERGIHVHVERDGDRIVDDTFAEVLLDGKVLRREDVFEAMVDNVVV
jgi:hypothetical protein